jgi:hypothetical protein
MFGVQQVGQEERLLLDAFASIGVELPRLALIEVVDEQSRERTMNLACRLLQRGVPARFRGVLYSAFKRKGASMHLRQLLRWHNDGSAESRYDLEMLEEAIVNQAAASNITDICQSFVRDLAFAQTKAWVFLLRQSDRRSWIREELRRAIDSKTADQGVVECVSVRYPRLWKKLQHP